VAVAALLEVTGAPVRLKMHIAGESLLNDGSAIVFFTIFSSLYLTELDMRRN
jgi:NhaP-type Na+/H+ or K+/H+ antiporter